MSRKNENSSFFCENCGCEVMPLTNGSYRNHCPQCLYSKHVDLISGDRKSDCGGLMKPVGILYNSKKGYQIQHRCHQCGFERVNKIAQGTSMPDSFDVILELLKQA